jgi:hypothetical protein
MKRHFYAAIGILVGLVVATAVLESCAGFSAQLEEHPEAFGYWAFPSWTSAYPVETAMVVELRLQRGAEILDTRTYTHTMIFDGGLLQNTVGPPIEVVAKAWDVVPQNGLSVYAVSHMILTRDPPWYDEAITGTWYSDLQTSVKTGWTCIIENLDIVDVFVPMVMTEYLDK